MLTPREIAAEAAKALENKQAKDIKVLHTSDVTVLADYFIICTATSSTHVKTLTDEVDRVLSEVGEPPLRREGYRGGGWILLDFGCVIVHISRRICASSTTSSTSGETRRRCPSHPFEALWPEA